MSNADSTGSKCRKRRGGASQFFRKRCQTLQNCRFTSGVLAHFYFVFANNFAFLLELIGKLGVQRGDPEYRHCKQSSKKHSG